MFNVLGKKMQPAEYYHDTVHTLNDRHQHTQGRKCVEDIRPEIQVVERTCGLSTLCSRTREPIK
ncbi:MAG: hypothetical protein L6406_08715 [Desulfobacterales bacterium]|nr:hypothetical protein [Desulfobacterales bacterium]